MSCTSSSHIISINIPLYSGEAGALPGLWGKSGGWASQYEGDLWGHGSSNCQAGTYTPGVGGRAAACPAPSHRDRVGSQLTEGTPQQPPQRTGRQWRACCPPEGVCRFVLCLKGHQSYFSNIMQHCCSIVGWGWEVGNCLGTHRTAGEPVEGETAFHGFILDWEQCCYRSSTGSSRAAAASSHSQWTWSEDAAG